MVMQAVTVKMEEGGVVTRRTLLPLSGRTTAANIRTRWTSKTARTTRRVKEGERPPRYCHFLGCPVCEVLFIACEVGCVGWPGMYNFLIGLHVAYKGYHTTGQHTQMNMVKISVKL